MFYDTFKRLCEEKGVSCNKAALEIGLSNATPTKWKKTGATPDSSTLAKVSRYFNVSISYLLGDTNDPADRSRTHWAEVVYQNEKAPTQEGERRRKLHSVARLESADITPELDKNIADYIDFLLKKREEQE